MVRLLMLGELAMIWKVSNFLLTLAGTLHADKHVTKWVKQMLSKCSCTVKLLTTVITLSLNQFGLCGWGLDFSFGHNLSSIQPFTIQLYSR